MQREKITLERFEYLCEALGWDETRAWILRCLLVGNASYDAMSAMTGKTANALYCDVRRAWQEIYRHDAEQRGERVDDPAEVIEHATDLQFVLEYEAGLPECLAAVRIVDPGCWRYTDRVSPVEEVNRAIDQARASEAAERRRLGLDKIEDPFIQRKFSQKVDNPLLVATE